MKLSYPPLQTLIRPLGALGTRLRHWLTDPTQASDLALLQALAIGGLVGFVTVLFRWTMGAIGTWRNHLGLHPTVWWQWGILPLIGLVGGAIAGHLTVHWAPDAKGSGIPQVKYALAHPSQPTRLRTVLVKFWGAAIAIGSGLSLGREGPTVQIGAGVGEWVSRWFPAPHERRKLMAAGAGAGLAAAFNAPIAGFVFVVEELLRNFSTQTMGMAILATVTASVITRTLAGNFFSYQLPASSFHLLDLPWYMALGLLGGLGGVAFIRGILASLDAYERDKWLPRAWHPALAGLLTGCIGLFFPMVIGGGHEIAELAFHAGLPLFGLVLAFALKFGLNLLAYGSGAPGGIFAPTLVLGALLGAMVGTLQVQWFGGDATIIAAFAYAGMGAMFTAVARAPVTAIIIVFELTGNYNQVLPLMVACVTAHLTAHALRGVSIYDALLSREGTPLPEIELLDHLSDLTVREVMSPHVETLDAETPLSDARARFAVSEHGGYPVTYQGALAGIVTRGDLLRAAPLPAETPLRAVMTIQTITVSPGDSLEQAWYLLTKQGIGRLVVTDPPGSTRVVGILTRSDLLQGSPLGFRSPQEGPST